MKAELPAGTIPADFQPELEIGRVSVENGTFTYLVLRESSTPCPMCGGPMYDLHTDGRISRLVLMNNGIHMATPYSNVVVMKCEGCETEFTKPVRDEY